MLERDIITQIKSFINGLPDGYCFKVHGDSYLIGEADIFGCVRGRAVVIEVKRPGEPLSLHQEANLEKWRLTGALALCARSVFEVRTALAEAGLTD